MLFKKPLDNELLKSVETVGEIRGAQILYINTGTFMRSVDLFFCLLIRLTNFFPIREGAGVWGRKIFSTVPIGNSMKKYLNEEYCEQDWRQCLENSC